MRDFVEAGEEQKKPPPLPRAAARAVDYQPQPLLGMEWVFVGSFSSLGKWHQVKAMLDRHGVVCRMGPDESDSNASGLFVPPADADAARALLSGDFAFFSETLVRGFPVIPVKNPASTGEAPTVLPVEVSQISPGERVSYTVMMVFFWLCLIVLVTITVLLSIWG